MRVIKVDGNDRDLDIIWWILAGAAVGTAAGILIAERRSGRKSLPRSLWRQARKLAKGAAGQWGPALAFALELKEAWQEARAEEDDEDWDEDEFEDADEYEAAYEPDDEFDEDLDESIDEESSEWDDEEDADEEDGEDVDDADDSDDADTDSEELASRVLEAFLNDPILSDRDVEIEADDEGHISLFGRVRSSKEAEHAATIAGGVPGVEDVDDYLRIIRRR